MQLASECLSRGRHDTGHEQGDRQRDRADERNAAQNFKHMMILNAGRSAIAASKSSSSPGPSLKAGPVLTDSPSDCPDSPLAGQIAASSCARLTNAERREIREALVSAEDAARRRSRNDPH